MDFIDAISKLSLYWLMIFAVLGAYGTYCDQKALKNITQEAAEKLGPHAPWSSIFVRRAYFTEEGLKYRNIVKSVSIAGVIVTLIALLFPNLIPGR